MIELYGMSSPNVRKVVIALEELGLPYERRHVAVFRGANFEPDFQTVSPFAKVPVLVDHDGPAQGRPIFESCAILVYLAEAYGSDLLPADGPARWATMSWLVGQAANVGPMLGQHSHFRMKAAESSYAALRYRKIAAGIYGMLERRLAAAPCLAGEAFSIADIATYPWARYLRRHGFDPADYPALRRWTDAIAARPAVTRADLVMRDWGQLDAADRQAATGEETERFFWLHFDAPSAEAAATTRGEPGHSVW